MPEFTAVKHNQAFTNRQSTVSFNVRMYMRVYLCYLHGDCIRCLSIIKVCCVTLSISHSYQFSWLCCSYLWQTENYRL